MDNYVNYHSHKMFTNAIVPDSPTKYEDYIDKAIELNQSIITSVEHGYQGNYWLLNELIENKNKEFQVKREKGEKNVPKDLKFIFGTEAYWVKDRHEKDKSNCHMILLAKNENGRRKINLALSKANEDGMFNGRPRLDFELLFELPKDDVFITTACLGYWNKYEDIDDITLKLYNYFKENFLLEVQNHNTESQKKINAHVLELSEKYGIKIIAGMDTHIIDKVKDTIKRDKILEYKGIIYEDEDGWFLDYPSYEVAFKRFQEQGILSDKKIYEALNNTNIIETFGNYDLNKNIKLPTLYSEKTQEEKDNLFKSIINEEWKKFKEKEHIKKEEIPMYLDGIRYEVEEVIKTKMTDYFLLHYVGLKKGVEKGGLITKRGRGCFTEDALVVTKNSLKKINKIEIGDYVITDDGNWNRVKNTFKYDIEEEMIEFKYQCQGSSYKKYRNVCTLDHKILVNRNNDIGYIKAEDIKIGDLLCQPKIKNNIVNNIVIDLQKYNTFGFEFDKNYIYEKYPVSKNYKYSPRWLEKQGIINSVFAKKIGQGYRLEDNIINNKRGEKNVKKLLNNTPFKFLNNYQKYINKNGFTRIAIPRYIKLDFLWNTFIGMMYGDGWTEHNTGLGFAINNTTKYTYNKYVFYKIAEQLGLNVIVNKSNNKNLIQLYVNSHILNNWFKTEFFESKKGKEKIFNSQLLDQSKNNLKALYNGLKRTDGSLNREDNKFSFDNTSLSLINAFKLLNNKLNYEPMTLDIRLPYTDSRGYKCQESYKLRRPIVRKIDKIQSDNNYWYLPIIEINKLNKQKISVYDMEIENNHSYMINNIIVHNSGVGFFINTLLGFSRVDRFKAPIKLYPERFLTADRILKSKSLPD